jgi:hypothetical protein
MKNLFNNISEEEKNRILEMHSGKKNVIIESDDEDGEPQIPPDVADKWNNITDSEFFTKFVRKYPSERKLKNKFKGENIMDGLENEFSDDFPGEDYLHDFFKELRKVDW